MTDHRCEPVFDADGQVIGRALVSPDLSEEGKKALAELVAAARRQFALDCEADPTIGERQAAARAWNRKRLVRLGIRVEDET